MKYQTIMIILFYLLGTNVSLAQVDEDYNSIPYLLSKEEKSTLQYFVKLKKADLEEYYYVFDSILYSDARDILKRSVIDSFFNHMAVIPDEIVPLIIDTFDFIIPVSIPTSDIDESDPLYPILRYIYKSKTLTEQMWGHLILSSKLKDCGYFDDHDPDTRAKVRIRINSFAVILMNHIVELNQLLSLTGDDCYRKNLQIIISRITVIKN